MEEQKISSDILRGHIDTIILRLLNGGDKYGYKITKLISENSGGEFDLKEASMYSSLKRMEKEGLITAYWGSETQGARRRYYKITAEGRSRYKTSKKNWEYAKQLLDKLI